MNSYFLYTYLIIVFVFNWNTLEAKSRLFREAKEDAEFVSRQQLGQYEDVETSLYYNSFIYYNIDTGTCLNQDPIGIEGNNLNPYAYLQDFNFQFDPFGLDLTELNITSYGEQISPYQSHNLIQDKSISENKIKEAKIVTDMDGDIFYNFNFSKNAQIFQSPLGDLDYSEIKYVRAPFFSFFFNNQI